MRAASINTSLQKPFEPLKGYGFNVIGSTNIGDTRSQLSMIYYLHILTMLVHLSLGILCVVLASTSGNPLLEVGYRAYDYPIPGTGPFASFRWLVTGHVSIKYMTASFFFITSASHAIQAGVYRNGMNSYDGSMLKHMLEHRVNPIRWIEYTITVAPIMSIMLGIIAGDRNILNFLNRAGTNAAMMFCGYLSETVPSMNWKIFIAGFVFGLPPLVQDMVLIHSAADFAQVPLFVKAIIYTTYILFWSFALWAFLEIRQVNRGGSCKDSYTVTEKRYLGSGDVTKIVLGMVLLFSVPNT